MSSPEPKLSGEARKTLLDLVRASIEYGLARGFPPNVDLSDYDEGLREKRASFVTLRRSGQLRGCMGTLQPTRPLAHDVVENAWRSAFADPRFPPLRRDELADLDIHISVLNPPEPLAVISRAELRSALRPGIDGLVLRDRGASATFLPSVWEQLETPERFLAELLRKAGLAPDHWSHNIEFERYTVEEF